jgi:hypothetical protein
MKFARMIVAAGAVMVALCSVAHSWDGAVVGTIKQFDVVTAVGGAPHNYAFRVYLTGFPAMCTGNVNGNNSWVYINSDETNYDTLAAAVMMSKSTASQVKIYSNVDSSGYCHLGYIQVM